MGAEEGLLERQKEKQAGEVSPTWKERASKGGVH